MFLERLATKIREQRVKRGLKQQDVANALNVSPQAVSKWERGENAPDIALIAQLAKLLGVSVDWLLSAHDEGRDVFEAAVLVSSVLGAYERSLRTKPRDFAVWANGLFYQLTEVTLANDGVPIKYMGDQYLCFFSGTRHCDRAAKAALEMKRLVDDDLKIGLSSGLIYLGSVGHPDYSRPDIMGEVVNIAFLTMQWAETHARSGIAATQALLDGITEPQPTGAGDSVNFKCIERPVGVVELLPA